jgi:signal peptidase I
MITHFIRSLTSRTYRKANELADAVRKVLEHQRDELSTEAVAQVESVLSESKAIFLTGNRAQLEAQMEVLHSCANQWLKPYPHSGAREYLIMAIELIVLILGSRAFLATPMSIPTGSAQPTFWGVTYVPLEGPKDVVIPNWGKRAWDLFVRGEAYCYAESEVDGAVEAFSKVQSYPVIPFLNKATITIGGHPHTVWFVPEHYEELLVAHDEKGGLLRDRNGAFIPKQFKRGEPILQVRSRAGDHLFVNRLTYNFRPPRRGETIVFRSETHPGMTANTHYIKRLIGLGGERIRIGDDRHVYVNGSPLTASDPGFENVYSFDPQKAPEKNIYSGHVNGRVARQQGLDYLYCRNFPDGDTEVSIPPGRFICFGDNTMNSADSRYWPDPAFPQERVIGKSWFVFWPFTERWGWSRH